MSIFSKTRLAIIGAGMAASIVVPALVGAQGLPGAGQGNRGNVSPVTGKELGLYYGEGLGLGTRSLQETVISIVRVLLSLLGIVALGIILMGGFKWMTAGGNDEQVGAAKKSILQGIIGLAIVLSAFAISKFVVESLTTAVADQQP